jgi:hypothetical protein
MNVVAQTPIGEVPNQVAQTLVCEIPGQRSQTEVCATGILHGLKRRFARERRRRKVGRAFDMALEIARIVPERLCSARLSVVATVSSRIT